MRKKHPLLRLLAAVLASSMLVVMGPVTSASAAGGPNLATGKTAGASSSSGGHGAGSLNDGNQATYWEGTGSFPQSAQVDLGASTGIDQVVVKLPAEWETRTQTFAVQGSADGTSFTTIVNSAGYVFGPGSNNTVTINFPATNTRYVRLNVTANTGWTAGQVAELEVYGAANSTMNLALGKTLSASGTVAPYGAGNANDGNQATYWESTNNAFPQWIQADLGSSVGVNRIVLKLPTGWESRTQTLTVQGSANGSTFSTVVASAGYAFNPATGNTVTINFNTTTARYIRLNITANTQWPAGQVSEFELYGPSTGDTQAPTAPGSLAYTQPATGQIRLTWNASTDNVGVTGYDIYANNVLRASVAGNVTTYTDTQSAITTVSYYVRAKDAAGNQSGNSNTVTRNGQPTVDPQAPTAPGNLAYTQPATGQIRLTWSASSDNVGVTGYDIYANNVLRGSVGGNVLTYTDEQPATATVSYHVRAKDAAGNESGNSNTVTRNGTGGGGSNLAVGKPITANGTVHTFVATNANDNDVNTYWEGAGGSYPNTLTVALGANAVVNQVVLRLNPSSAWGTRTQNIQVVGREQSATGFTNLVAAANYTFNPATGNTVTIPLSATVADVQLRITGNTGAPAGQVAEFQVIGVPAPNPDLTVSAMSFTPASPTETDSVTLSATVRNIGSAGSGATNVNFYLGTALAGTAPVAALAAGGTATVTVNAGTRDAATYPLSAKVDENNTVIEQNDTNNAYTNPTSLVVRPVDSSDLIASPVSWSPNNPANGNNVTFSVAIKNQGNVASASGAHGITLTLLNATTGAVVRTLTGSHTGTIAPGATANPVNLGSWTAANGKYTVRVVLADDANELPVKRANNSTQQPFFVGRGANMPYDMYEAEDGVIGGGAAVVGPNRTVGDIAGEASGRKAVTLNSNGSYVEFTTKASTNTLVTRFSIPDAAGGGGINSSLNIYVNGTFLKPIPLTSRYAWLYGNEASPGNSPGAGGPRHIYDEANIMLGTTVPAGSKIRLQKDPANSTTYAIDFINLEQVSPIANPDPVKYTVPTGLTHQDVQNALDRVRMDTTGNLVGVYLPPGDYQTSSKFQVYGKPVQVVGAGPWYSRFFAPATQDNTDVGFRAEGSARGSSFTNFSYWGNYTSRIDGPGKVFDFGNISDITIDNVWAEHMVCLYWGLNTDRVTIKNSRIRNTFADAINMTNGSTDNHVTNNEARGTGDDSFALFSAIDAGGSDITGNVYENLTSTLTWRAAGVAVYGGYDNVFRNIYIADTLVYSGITISSLDFGYPMNGFGASPPTRFENISIVRAGGHFWGAQTFPGIWVFSASKVFQGIRVSDVDIVEPTYSGIMFQTNYVGGQPQFPVTDTVFTNVSITGAAKSGDAYDAKSGYGIWVNEMPEPGQGPARGSATFNNLQMSNNAVNIRNTTSTFTLNINP
ncbi:glycosyl hydrolase [Microtetraspora sp. NBRC 13810]|uniref:discoidin domain-containing protein n=1 Tax=Microtetraspora sp. NBRC 13810 TaxID=3030990 RepID=UPI0024A2DBB3|nr:discoidin domain-containing protein [Microtetraspora sp. NBRC 13810]GLW05948.1 glycosyl hydrolase [Microtetraspora sp. NBRC 13810]